MAPISLPEQAMEIVVEEGPGTLAARLSTRLLDDTPLKITRPWLLALNSHRLEKTAARISDRPVIGHDCRPGRGGRSEHFYPLLERAGFRARSDAGNASEIETNVKTVYLATCRSRTGKFTPVYTTSYIG